jgi:CheY-like chemotaxis protein
MNIVCAKCGAGVAYELSSLATQTVVVCSACGSGLKVSIEPIAVPGGSVRSAPVSITPVRRPAVVAVQGEATRELIGELLTSAGFTVTEVGTGSETLAKVGVLRPVLVLVDVGFSDMPGFQVCEALRSDASNAGVKIVLVAAIHNKDRYRRPPDKLYGADDYIERHRIESELIDKVNRLCGGSSVDEAPAPAHAQENMPTRSFSAPAPSAPSPESPVSEELGAAAGVKSAQPTIPQPSRPLAPPAPERVQASPPAQASERGEARPPDATPPAKDAPTAPPVSAPANPAQEAALRLARIIVSDIALYNAKKVDEGVMNGTFFDLLRTEIEEGRKLYEERKGPGLATTVDLFRQTLDQFVATRRELLKRSRPAAA